MVVVVVVCESERVKGQRRMVCKMWMSRDWMDDEDVVVVCGSERVKGRRRMMVCKMWMSGDWMEDEDVVLVVCA